MKLPKLIQVGTADYEIRHVKRLDMLGESLSEDTTILIKRAQSASSKRETLFHELLHAVIWMSGYGYGLEHSAEEQLVRALSPWILGALRDNPGLVAFLTEGCDG